MFITCGGQQSRFSLQILIPPACGRQAGSIVGFSLQSGLGTLACAIGNPKLFNLKKRYVKDSYSDKLSPN
nr:hypothetical protein [uncultured Pedobacter sp.]